MKTVSNLLILGAGASHEFDLPTGIKLKKDAVSLLDGGPSKEFNLLREAGQKLRFTDADLVKFLEKLKKDKRNLSIDSFIEANQDNSDIDKMTQIAKCIIAIIINRYEMNREIKVEGNTWCDQLFEMMYRNRKTFDSFFENKINFVTFNYDRTLEEYLLKKIIDVFPKSEYECMKRLSEAFEVIHVHGSLGDLWVTDSKYYRPYRTKIKDIDDLVRISENIRLVTDKIIADQDKLFCAANKLIREADTVHFLGFAYHGNNMERLGFLDGEILVFANPSSPIEIEERKCFGTIRGVTRQDVNSCVRQYKLVVTEYIPQPGLFGLAGDVTNATAFEYMSIGPFD